MKWQKILLASLPPLVISGVVGYFIRLSKGPEAAKPVSSASSVVQRIQASSVASVPKAASVSAAPTAPLGTVRQTKEQIDEQVRGREEPDETVRDSAYYTLHFKEKGVSLSAYPPWISLVNHPQGLWILVKAVEQVSGGNRPLALAGVGNLSSLRPFEAVQVGDVWRMSRETEGRFSSSVGALSEVDVQAAAELFRTLEPELDRILHEDLGYPADETFRDMLFEAMGTLLKTPVPEESPDLVKITDRLYRFAHPDLEKLNGAQKFLLRMGKENQEKVNLFLRRFWKTL